MDFRAAEEHIIKTRSESVLVDALRERGFTAVEENADFFVVTKWKKGVSIAPSRYAPINEPDTDFNRRLQNDLMYGVIVEMLEAEKGDQAPPKPLILAAWNFSSDSEKRIRMEEQMR